ncbi:hypothetical protein [Thalassovita sp.]|uniref:hypothetical protein n=1 Tax=Thalassovita sp. TaxID=1979401 RepID=UPI0029DE822B|nr:hypothetical protein [Thalassovita sp.]
MTGNGRRLIKLLARARNWFRRRLPPGLRLVAGLLLMVGGVFGFLPVVGFWMLPLGVAVAALDVLPVWRALRRRFKPDTPDDTPRK